ncbi:MAG: hypothetical protein V4730_11935 [Pseudomonadota bacterium]
MSHLLTTAPGLPALLAELFAAAEKRRTTPTSQPVSVVLPPVTLTDAERIEIDMAMHQDKLNDGYERRRQARAVALEQGSRRFT